MKEFMDYLNKLENHEQRDKMQTIFNWILETFPNLKTRVAWNQPMFTDHDTFIIGFSASKKHMSVAPELAGMNKFEEAISKAGYDRTKQLFKIKWAEEVDYELLKQIIEFNIMDKAECTTFWRK